MRMNVAIQGQIARIVKRKMEHASSVNQDIGGTTVKIHVVLGVQMSVRSQTEVVRHVCPDFGEKDALIYVTMNHAVNNVMITYLIWTKTTFVRLKNELNDATLGVNVIKLVVNV